ncbi:hypothetical protein [Nonomuraea sp. 10N515B]|uniref:hypothetical protein n=1 Tax=Nonomuraea sp. 10N515B TaxID=3457422 RepID=UPI003FCC3949
MLTHVLRDSPADRGTVERQVLQLVNPDAREALNLLDGIEQLNAKLDEMAGKSKEDLAQWGITEARGKLAQAGKKLTELIEQSQKAGRSTTTLDEVIGRYQAVRTRVLVEALDLPPTVDPTASGM